LEASSTMSAAPPATDRWAWPSTRPRPAASRDARSARSRLEAAHAPRWLLASMRTRAPASSSSENSDPTSGGVTARAAARGGVKATRAWRMAFAYAFADPPSSPANRVRLWADQSTSRKRADAPAAAPGAGAAERGAYASGRDRALRRATARADGGGRAGRAGRAPAWREEVGAKPPRRPAPPPPSSPPFTRRRACRSRATRTAAAAGPSPGRPASGLGRAARKSERRPDASKPGGSTRGGRAREDGASTSPPHPSDRERPPSPSAKWTGVMASGAPGGRGWAGRGVRGGRGGSGSWPHTLPPAAAPPGLPPPPPALHRWTYPPSDPNAARSPVREMSQAVRAAPPVSMGKMRPGTPAPASARESAPRADASSSVPGAAGWNAMPAEGRGAQCRPGMGRGVAAAALADEEVVGRGRAGPSARTSHTRTCGSEPALPPGAQPAEATRSRAHARDVTGPGWQATSATAPHPARGSRKNRRPAGVPAASRPRGPGAAAVVPTSAHPAVWAAPPVAASIETRPPPARPATTRPAAPGSRAQQVRSAKSGSPGAGTTAACKPPGACTLAPTAETATTAAPRGDRPTMGAGWRRTAQCMSREGMATPIRAPEAVAMGEREKGWMERLRKSEVGRRRAAHRRSLARSRLSFPSTYLPTAAPPPG